MDETFENALLGNSDIDEDMSSTSSVASSFIVIGEDERKVQMNEHWKATNKRKFYWKFYLPLTSGGKEFEGTKNSSTTCWIYCILCQNTKVSAHLQMNPNKKKHVKGIFY